MFWCRWSFGSVLFLASWAVLMGPWTYLLHLISTPRLPFTAAYFTSIALTLVFAIKVCPKAVEVFFLSSTFLTLRMKLNLPTLSLPALRLIACWPTHMTASKHLFDLDLFYSAISGFTLVSRQLFPYGRHRSTICRTGGNQSAISMDVRLMSLEKVFTLSRVEVTCPCSNAQYVRVADLTDKSMGKIIYKITELQELIVDLHETGIICNLADQRWILIADLLSSDAIRSRPAYATQLRSDPSLKRFHAKNISVAYMWSRYRVCWWVMTQITQEIAWMLRTLLISPDLPKDRPKVLYIWSLVQWRGKRALSYSTSHHSLLNKKQKKRIFLTVGLQ